METVLKATAAQKNALHGYTKGGSTLEFIQDDNGNWVVGCEVLDCLNYADIMPELQSMVPIIYIPKVD